MNADSADRWYEEAVAAEIHKRDVDVAEAADLPAELAHFAIAADLDPDFHETFDEWLEWLLESHDAFGCHIVLLALEQSASNGVVLPWSMRGVRLFDAHPEVIERLHYFWSRCPAHVAAYLTNYVYWLVRSERGRRRGTPEWSPRMSAPAAPSSAAGWRPD